MRGKIIAVFSVIVIVSGLLAFVLIRAVLGDKLSSVERAKADASRSASAASAQLQLEALAQQRWLGDQSRDPQVREPFQADTAAARGEFATAQSNRLFSRAQAEFPGAQPTLVAFVDEMGKAVGRNGGALMRGDDLGKVYPGLLDALKRGSTASDVWVNRQRNEQMFVSYAAVRDAVGKPLGVLLLGSPLDDGRITNVSELTSGRPLVVAITQGDAIEVVAKSNNTPPSFVSILSEGLMKGAIASALAASRPTELQNAPVGEEAFGVGLAGYGDGKRAALVAVSEVALIDNVSGLLLGPILGAMLISLVLVVAAGVFFGSYISRPIVELEEGLLQIINGQGDRRFEMEHAEFGGLIFRINTLLNTLMEVPEDNTDEQGRPSTAPSNEAFREALSVDERGTESVDRSAVALLKAEAPEAYYQRLYTEYVQAKKTIGDPGEPPTREAFMQRLKSLEAEASAKGKLVRYKVEVRDGKLSVVAVPLD